MELDTEFIFRATAVRTLTEGVAAGQASYQEEPGERVAFTRIAAELVELGLPLSALEYEAPDEAGHSLDPEKFMKALAEVEREKRGLRRAGRESRSHSAADLSQELQELQALQEFQKSRSGIE